MRYYLLLILFSLFFASCKERQKHHVTRGIYYWKTVYNPSWYERNILQKLDCEKIYIRLFDVDWNDKEQRPMPVATLRSRQPADYGIDYVPVIFITQKALLQMRRGDIQPLTKSISVLAYGLCQNMRIESREVQIDCDWTPKTKDVYFELLRELRKVRFFKNKKLSATIRMHQAKYVKLSGVPPVDKGLLMCYNMGDLKKPGERNSILDYDEAKKYLQHISAYPLPLDIALPVFSWTVLFRDNRFKGILRDVRPALVRESKLFRQVSGNIYRCAADTAWQGYAFKKGDVVRCEESLLKDVKKVAAYSNERVANKELNLLLFHCDSLTLSQYKRQDLEEIYSMYR